MVRDLFSWLVSGKGGKKGPRDQIINLKLVSKRLARSQKKLENKEKQTERKIRGAMQKGDMQSARMYANDVVRSRKWARGYQSLTSKIDGLIFKLERTDAVQTLASEMKGVAKSLQAASGALDIAGMDDIVADMNESLENIEISSEMMEDSVDDLFSGDIEEGEVDNLLAEYGADIGISASAGLPTAVAGQTAKSTNSISDLQKEIEELRKQE